MTYTEAEARERLEEAIYFTQTANMGTTPDQLLDDYRDAVLRSAAEKAEAAIERVRALHVPARGGRSGWNPDDDDTPGAYGHIANACEECGSQDLAVSWPCPTIQALEDQ